MENSPRYPYAEKTKPLEKTHTLVHVKACPSNGAFPVRRLRLFASGLSKKSLVWTGVAPDQIQADWDRFVYRALYLTGDSLMLAPKKEVEEMIRDMAHVQKRGLPNKWREMSMESLLPFLLPPGALARKASYDKIRPQKQGRNGAYFADFEHNEGKGGPAPGPLVPTLITHGTVYCYNKKRTAPLCICFSYCCSSELILFTSGNCYCYNCYTGTTY